MPAPAPAETQLLECEAEPRELFVGVPALDRRLEVELLDEIGILADQLARQARQLLVGCLTGLEEVERAPALSGGVRDPGLQPQPLDVLERVDRLVAQVPAQLLD